ncbi:MAG: hypothetical protein ACRCVW_02320 [Brevinema sp.]
MKIPFAVRNNKLAAAWLNNDDPANVFWESDSDPANDMPRK